MLSDRCCRAQKEDTRQQGWWRSASGCVGSGTLLVLLPKCPMCIGAYLALWMGAGVAMPFATHLRPALEALFAASAVLVLGRLFFRNMRTLSALERIVFIGRQRQMTFARLFTAALLTCAPLSAADSKTVDKTLALPPTGSVTIDGHNGSIRINTWDRPEIEIHARIEMNSGFGLQDSTRRFDETRVDIDSFGDSVRIKSRYPEWGVLPGNNPEIHYTINAPRTARWTIRDHNSKIEVNDLHAALNISTHNSRVIVSGLAGPLDLDTHNGDAKVQFASLTASSSVGMHNGDVELIMPASSKFNLQTSSHNARVQSDFSILTRSMTRRGTDIEGTVNGGGPMLRLTSHNGTFRLRAN
jgi:Putative adhesin